MRLIFEYVGLLSIFRADLLFGAHTASHYALTKQALRGNVACEEPAALWNKLSSNSQLSSPQQHVQWTSEYAAISTHYTIFVRIIKFRKFLTISESSVATWRTREIEFYFACQKCLMVLL